VTNEGRVALRQQRDLGQIFDAALTIYRQNFSVLFSIAALVIPLGIAGGIFQTISDDVANQAITSVIGLCQVGVNILAGSAVIVAINDADQGRTPEFGRSYDIAFSRFGTLIMAFLRVAFHVILFFITIVGIPWAIQRAIRWAFTQQTIMLENANWEDALGRSADVVIGSWWRTFGILLLIGIVAGVPVGIVTGVLVFAPVLVSSTVSATVQALISPLASIAATLLYFDLKVRKQDAARPAPTGA